MPFVTSKDGLKISYQKRGSGAPLAMIMGFGGSSHAWSEAFLQLIEKQFELLVIDNRGTGDSDKPDRPWSLLDMASDAIAMLDNERVANAHVFGISMGGMIAQELVLNHPGRVRRLILGCTNCGASHSAPAAPEDVQKLVPDPALSQLEQAQRALSVACAKTWLESTKGQQFVLTQFAEMAKYPLTPMHTYMRQMNAIMGFDSFERLGTIRTPTMVMAGDADRIVPVKNSEILSQAIAGARLKVLPGAGHMFPWEQMEATVSTVGEFLNARN